MSFIGRENPVGQWSDVSERKGREKKGVEREISNLSKHLYFSLEYIQTCFLAYNLQSTFHFSWVKPEICHSHDADILQICMWATLTYVSSVFLKHREVSGCSSS